MIYYTKRSILRKSTIMRDNIVGGALTETTFLILLAFSKPNHGYGVMQEIRESTHGRVELGLGTLYGAINTLEKKKWIKKTYTTKEGKKVFELTEEGNRRVETEIQRLEEMLQIANQYKEGI